MNSVAAWVAGVTFLGQACLARSGLILDPATVSTVSEPKEQEDDHRNDYGARPPADPHSFLRLGMEIDSARSLLHLVVRSAGGQDYCLFPRLISTF